MEPLDWCIGLSWLVYFCLIGKGEMSEATECPRVEAIIDAVMARYPGITPAARARYYDAVHQELAPLARKLEQENSNLQAENDRLRESLKAILTKCRAGVSVNESTTGLAGTLACMAKDALANN